MTTFTVGYFVGSLAKASINRKLAIALTRLAPSTLDLREIPIGDLPLYSYDYDEAFPPAGVALKDAIASVDAVLFVTPEYNRSIPGALKNAIDWASRPWGTNSFSRKPSAIIGTSPGKIGTAVAQQHLRSILAFCNSPLMNSVEAYIQFEDGLIGEDGVAERHVNAVITDRPVNRIRVLKRFKRWDEGFFKRCAGVWIRVWRRQGKFEIGDWVSFEKGGVMFRYTVIAYVYRVYDESLTVVLDGVATEIPKDAVLERRGRK